MFMRGLRRARPGRGAARGDRARAGRTSGICLGLQVLFDESEEHGPVRRASASCAGRVVRLRAERPRAQGPAHGLEPRARARRASPLLAGVADERVLLLRALVPRGPGRSGRWSRSSADHGGRSPRRSASDNLFACQFHPEKSQAVGLRILAQLRRSAHEAVSPRSICWAARRCASRRASATARPCFTTSRRSSSPSSRATAPSGCTSSISTARSASRASTRWSRAIVAASPVPVEVGGGIRDRAAVEAVLALGAALRRARHRRGASRPRSSRRLCRAYPGRSSSRSTRATAWSPSRAGPRSSGVTAIELGAARRRAGAPPRCSTPTSRATASTRGPNVAATAALAARRRRSTVIASGGVGALDDLARCATPASPRSSSAARSTTGASRVAEASAHRARQRLMLARRIIPCLDVKDGRVVKGINFLELRDAGDPVEQAAAYDAQGADEICFLDISASPEGRATHRRRRRAHRRPGVHAAHRRRRRALGRRLPSACSRPAPTRSRSTPPRSATPELVDRAAPTRFGSPGDRRRDRRQARRGDGAAGRCTATAAARPRGSTRSPGARSVARPRRGRDPADQHGSRRHRRRATTSS